MRDDIMIVPLLFPHNASLQQMVHPALLTRVGLNLYVLKGVAPPEVSLDDIIRGAAPYWFIDAIALFVIVLFPALVTWLPNAFIK